MCLTSSFCFVKQNVIVQKLQFICTVHMSIYTVCIFKCLCTVFLYKSPDFSKVEYKIRHGSSYLKTKLLE